LRVGKIGSATEPPYGECEEIANAVVAHRSDHLHPSATQQKRQVLWARARCCGRRSRIRRDALVLSTA